ncbi:Uncharacterised protein [Clostridioides difficile]|uniref:hypothetical protein n=1 Tax=Clostridioides difficile TaxID=1496 RepID=UPI00102868BE|nr:hypothetical protein [Clostridioides difficile]VFF93568.1 Uncharacterised protein [Clostridioides difficile]VIG04833.1 Uncharacterised protein [Clostridioides difficile]HBF4772052.1 hypothetical protein [Clostridioides difficile]HBF5037981.1 hypothetical protein [Clostridioides difficile]HBF5410706.1 hypothetical protein [Clostridioides difficile]
MFTTLDNLICPDCLQQLTINRTYEKQNGTIVRFFVKYKSNYKHNENCIFKQKVISGFSKNEINIRNENDDIWDKYNATVIVFNKDEPCINSAIETKINIYSNFYTRCLYSKIQKEAYEIECRNKKVES